MKIKLLISVVICSLFFADLSYGQWTVATTVVTGQTFPAISVAGQNVVWIARGTSGVPLVYRSTNGGTNFTNVTGTGISLDLFCIWARDADVAFVGNGGGAGGTGGNASFYKTTNGGTTWTLVASTGGTLAFFNGITFSKLMPSFGIAQSDPPTGSGQPYYVSKTTDGGTTWTLTNPPGITGEASAANSIVVLDNMWYGFGLNASSRVYFTTNGGTNWTIGTLGIAGTFVSGFAMSDNKTLGIAATQSSLPSIARTTNGGTTWATVNVGTGFTGYCTTKWIEGTNTCYISCDGAGATGGAIKKSTDGGATWTTMTTGGITGVQHMEFTRIGTVVYGYAVTSLGTVLKLVDNVTGIEPINNLIPSQYKLGQNYPNPFNPSTTIEFSIPISGNVSLKVYDALGKEVASILDGYRTAGNYSEQFIGTELTSGVYYYQLISGDYKQTKKFMLVK
ncbi:MAG TPA: T9SS type A sorting domain-containing protein [Ignavibacteria bacterium]|nr:T9SS type A sorting domain-containing protein [Ignavibacteria bacterium]